MRTRRSVIALAVAIFLLTGTLRTAEPPDARLRTTSVAAFKNGLGFFIRQGQVRSAAGEGRILAVPSATLGALWVAPNDPGATLEELVAYHYAFDHLVQAASLADLLRLNVGKIATVTYNEKVFKGEIVAFPAEAPKDGTLSNSSQMLLLRSEGRIIALNAAGVTQVELPDNSQWTAKVSQTVPALRFKLHGAPETAQLTMGYLQKGLGWTPSYLITLEDEKTARVQLQSVVTNDAEDLQDAEVFFVVGVPNFRYSETLSPMAIQQALAEYMRDARADAGAGVGRGFGGNNALTGQFMQLDERNAFRGENSEADLRAAVAELEGAPEEDLFLYRRAHTNLARGERATYDVFAAKIPYEHIYEWEVPDTTHIDAFGNAQQPYNLSPQDRAREALNDVWHSLRLTNTSQFPFTSAPAMALSGVQPLAQDTLPYTPRGGRSNLKLTIATDVRPHREELEVERQINALNAHGYSYDAVTVEGTFKIKSYKSRPIRLLIGKTLTGAVLSATEEGKSKRLAVAVQAENPTSHIDWDLKLAPNEEKAIVYRYKVFVRR